MKAFFFSEEERMQTFNEFEKVIYQISHILYATRMLWKLKTTWRSTKEEPIVWHEGEQGTRNE